MARAAERWYRAERVSIRAYIQGSRCRGSGRRRRPCETEGDGRGAVELEVKWAASPRVCSLVGQGCQQTEESTQGEAWQAEDFPGTSKLAIGQHSDPLPVRNVVNGVRGGFDGLCIATGLEVLGAMMEADRELPYGPKGSDQVVQTRGGAAGWGAGSSAEGESQWRACDGRRPPARWTGCAAGGRRRGIDARYVGTLGAVPTYVTERATLNSTVWRRFVAVSAERLESFSAGGWGVGPAGGLRRWQGLLGPVHGDLAQIRHGGRETRVGPARRRHGDGCHHHRSVERLGNARTADGPDVAVRQRWRSWGAPGAHRGVRFSRGGGTLRSPPVQERRWPSAGAAARLCWEGAAGWSGTSIRWIARRGCWSGWRGRWSATTAARRRPSARVSRKR